MSSYFDFFFQDEHDEESVVIMLKKHLILQQGIEQYGKNIKDLAEQSQKLLALDHPDGYKQMGTSA